MPQLGIKSVKRLFLPSTEAFPDVAEKAWCDVAPEIVVGDIVDSEDYLSESQKGIFILSRIIADWNFTDASGVKVPVTVDSVKQLSVLDFKFLMEYLQENMTLPDNADETKKKEI